MFRKLSQHLGSDFEVLLFYIPVRWFSAGNVLNRIFPLKDQSIQFLQSNRKPDLFNKLAESTEEFAYIVNIFQNFECTEYSAARKRSKFVLSLRQNQGFFQNPGSKKTTFDRKRPGTQQLFSITKRECSDGGKAIYLDTRF